MAEVFGGLSAGDFLSDADTRVAYSKTVTREVTKKSKMKPFIATSENDSTSIIRSVLKTLEHGSVVGVSMEDALIESGATGNVDFSASGEELKNIKQFIKIDRFQHSVPSTESIVNQRSADSFKSRSKNSLSNWGTMKFDKIAFSALSANCTNIVVCGHHTEATPANLIKADVLTTTDVEEAKRRALLGVNALGESVPPLIPVKTTQNENMGYYDEVEYFVMFVGTNSARNIKTDPNWEAARKDALERGKSNPIFSGALGFWDGVLLLDVKTDTARQSGVLTSSSKFVGFGNVKSADLTIYKGGLTNQETEINLLVGAGAGYIVVDQGVAYYDWVDGKDPRLMHAGVDRVYGFAKTKYEASENDGILADSIFNGNDYGVIAVVASTGI